MIGGDWKNVEPMHDGERKRMPAGGYVIRMRSASQKMSRKNQPYLEVEYDIAEGEWSNHYQEIFDRFGFWGGKFSVFFAGNAKGFFRGFIDDVEQSNPGISLITPAGIDERQLSGLLVGIVLGEEEYMSTSGEIKTRLKRVQLLPIDKIRSGEFEIPEKKLYQGANVPPASDVVDMTQTVDFEQITEELPF